MWEETEMNKNEIDLNTEWNNFVLIPRKKPGICSWSPASPMFSQTQKYHLIVKVNYSYIYSQFIYVLISYEYIIESLYHKSIINISIMDPYALFWDPPRRRGASIAGIAGGQPGWKLCRWSSKRCQFLEGNECSIYICNIYIYICYIYTHLCIWNHMYIYIYTCWNKQEVGGCQLPC
jgi:hypothetical protein